MKLLYAIVLVHMCVNMNKLIYIFLVLVLSDEDLLINESVYCKRGFLDTNVEINDGTI